MISNGAWSLDGHIRILISNKYRREANLEDEFLYLQGIPFSEHFRFFYSTIEDMEVDYVDKESEFDNLNFMLYYFSVEFSKLKITIV